MGWAEDEGILSSLHYLPFIPADFPTGTTGLWDVFIIPGMVLVWCTSSVSPELLQRFACTLARIAFLRIMPLLSINMKAIGRASFLQSREQADQCNNSGETGEVDLFDLEGQVLTRTLGLPAVSCQ